MSSSWGLSFLLHLCLIVPLVFLSFFKFETSSNQERIEVDWIKPEQTATEIKPIQEIPVEIQQKKPTTLPTKQVERVFGIDQQSLRSNDPDSLVLKEGNTIAKEVDQKKLIDKTPLPTPKPEFLVTQMPVLKFKPEIPYPPEAKKKEIEGKVLLNILIDENGKVRRAEVIEGPGYKLNETALEKIYQFIFQPAKIGEQNVPVQIRYAVTFQLRL